MGPVGEGPPFGGPSDLGISPDGSIVVVGRRNDAIYRVDPVTGDRELLSNAVLVGVVQLFVHRLPQVLQCRFGLRHQGSAEEVVGTGERVLLDGVGRQIVELLDDGTRRVLAMPVVLEPFAPDHEVPLIWQTPPAEINNGGFHQYYFNSSGDLAADATGALDTREKGSKSEAGRKRALRLSSRPRFHPPHRTRKDSLSRWHHLNQQTTTDFEPLEVLVLHLVAPNHHF